MGEINITTKEKPWLTPAPERTHLPSLRIGTASSAIPGKPRIHILHGEDGGADLYCFTCPACQYEHSYIIGGDGRDSRPRWTFSGTLEVPTFRPSLRMLSGNKCHLTMTNGLIKFHEDSKHALAGQTVPCPEVEE